MKDIVYLQLNTLKELTNFKKLVKPLKTKLNLNSEDKKLFPIAFDFKNNLAYTISSPSICALCFVSAKNKRLSLEEFKQLIA